MKKWMMVEHKDHRILLQITPKGEYKYSMYKFVNGEQFGIASNYPEDNNHNRDMFIAEALPAFERARAAPFN